MPGVTIRKPREKGLLLGWRTALTVCQAISIAMTVVLPAPVASFRARRSSSGLACSLAPSTCAQNLLRRACRASARPRSARSTVSTASTWQKNGRMLWNGWWRQCCSSRAVSGVTCHWSGLGRSRQRFDVLADLVDDRGRVVLLLLGGEAVAAARAPARPDPGPGRRRFFGFGTGVISSDRRRTSRMRLVGCPSGSSSQCLAG